MVMLALFKRRVGVLDFEPRGRNMSVVMVMVQLAVRMRFRKVDDWAESIVSVETPETGFSRVIVLALFQVLYNVGVALTSCCR